MKISKIVIKNFRAFQGEYTINLHDGKNLLLYGENGSGKSSLYQALNLFISETPSRLADYKNIFVTTDDGYVKVEIGDGTNPSKTYEWEETAHPSTETLIVEASKTKGFLDYKALLETHYIQRNEDKVNVFKLLVETLLRDVVSPTFPSSNITVNDEWNSIRNIAYAKYTRDRENKLKNRLPNFNAGLTQIINDLTIKSNQILDMFEQEVSSNLSLEGGVQYDKTMQELKNAIVSLTASYYKHSVPRHHIFLNEARLSAIAISIYLGALLMNPPSRLKVLFLDDVLIGLDISNRLPLLSVIEKFFSDWQIILATYDKVWFDMAWQKVENSKEWDKGELYYCKTSECDVPIYKFDNIDYIKIAQGHLYNHDLKAAAIYIRSAY